MIDLNKIISGLSQSGAAAGLAGGLAGGTVVGALSSKKGRKAAKSAAKIGGLALVGGLAYKAYRDYQDGQRRAGPGQADAGGGVRTPATAIGPQAPGAAVAATGRWGNVGRDQFAAIIEEPPEGESRSLLLVRAMIAAAMADGHLDADEQGHLFREIDRLELSAEEKGMMLDELRHPWPMHAIVARCDAPETAIEVYAASVLAIDESRPESELYLSQLARLLQLPTTLVEEIHVRSGSEKSLPLAEPA